MLKILSVQQIRDLDNYTIENEPIASIDLMERASVAFSTWYVQRFSPQKKIAIVCGVGNNGGDGLAVARILREKQYSVQVFILGDVNKSSEDFRINLERLNGISMTHIENMSSVSSLQGVDIIIDAIFGSGLSRSLDGLYVEVVRFINTLKKTIVAVDISSGLFADKPGTNINEAIQPDYTIAFQVPKLCFLLPQNHMNVGEWQLVDIGLSNNYISELKSDFRMLEPQDVSSLLKKRSKYDHKGSNGKALIMTGGYGKMGASVLSARAAMRTGLGLLTLYVPGCGYQVIQTSVPEAMTITDHHERYITSIPEIEKYDAVGIGPGLGQAPETASAVSELISSSVRPLVLDADALNIISEHRTLLEILPSESILTPHPKEFERLVGFWNNDYERLEKQRQFSVDYKLIVVLKGAHTSITDSVGQVYFNSTGNPGMATGGSGDVLLGMITSLLAQGYSTLDSAIVGVYLHGLAGDLASHEVGEYSLIASDIIQSLPKAIQSLNG